MKTYRFPLQSAFASAILIAPLVLQATPPSDPICGAPNSLEVVRAIRAQMAAEASALRAPVLLQQALVLPQLSIEPPHALDPARLILGGAPGQTYHLEATSDPGSANWSPWLSVVLGDQPLAWSDDSMRTTPFQFYRLRAGDPGASAESASNFRLLDQTGTARDLYYHTHLQAIAVLAAGTNLDRVVPLIPFLDDLANTYTNKLQIWILLSDPAPIRSNVLARTTSLRINYPVLLDQFGLAARSVGLNRAGEVALVQPPAFTVALRLIPFFRPLVKVDFLVSAPDSLDERASSKTRKDRQQNESKTTTVGSGVQGQDWS